jgi:hypothetical protein
MNDDMPAQEMIPAVWYSFKGVCRFTSRENVHISSKNNQKIILLLKSVLFACPLIYPFPKDRAMEKSKIVPRIGK